MAASNWQSLDKYEWKNNITEWNTLGWQKSSLNALKQILGEHRKANWAYLVSKFICWVSGLLRLMVTGDGVCFRTRSRWFRSLSHSLRNSVLRWNIYTLFGTNKMNSRHYLLSFCFNVAYQNLQQWSNAIMLQCLNMVYTFKILPGTWGRTWRPAERCRGKASPLWRWSSRARDIDNTTPTRTWPTAWGSYGRTGPVRLRRWRRSARSFPV